MMTIEDNRGKENRKARPKGTVLGDRYELCDQIGRGGFSIVYSAIDRETQQQVAVKECIVSTEKERFLREAKLLEDFAEEDAIVTVLDFFEENDTAYIVMEYLDGETLRENVEKHGAWGTENAIHLMVPVMETLSHMHSKGVIHRDISPDNLMVMKDGSLKLLDFGAARQYEDNTLSRLVVKASYSPPEQMDAKGVFGSWSDVYSVCAAIYFCITGHNPEDAISRLMIDDLKKPSELGAEILASAEKALMRGMALDSKERIRNMEQLRTELEKSYPILSEEEKRVLKKKRFIRKMAIAGAAVIAAAAVLVYINIDSIRLAWHKAHGTETIILYGSNMSDEEFLENADKAEARISALAADKGGASCERIGHTISMEIPAGIFEDPLESIDRLVSPPLKFYIMNNDNELISDLLPERDITSVAEVDKGRLKIEFTKEAQKKLGDSLSDEHEDITFYSELEKSVIYVADSTGDGKTVELYDDYDQYDDLPVTFIEETLTNAPLSKAFNTTQLWNTKWEDPANSDNPGEWQIREEDLAESGSERLRIRYCLGSDAARDHERTKYETRKELSELRDIIKQRLDILQIPYAIGRVRYEKESLIIELPQDSINHEMAVILGMNLDDLLFRLDSDRYFNELSLLYDWLKYDVDLVEDGSDKYIRLTSDDFINRDSKAAILNFLSMIKDSGEKDFYISYMEVPVARVDIEEAINSIENNGVLEFREWCAADGKEDDLIAIVKQMIEFIDKTPITSDSLYGQNRGVLKGVQKIDSNGNISCFNADSDLVFAEEQQALSYIDAWNSEYKNELRFVGDEFEGSTDVLDYRKSLYIYDTSANIIDDKAIERFCKFYKDNKEKLEDGTFKDINYQFCGGFDSVHIERNEIGEYYIKLISSWNTKNANIIKTAITNDSKLKYLITADTIK